MHSLSRFCLPALLLLAAGLAACSSNTAAEPGIPSAVVNEQLNLTNQQYAALRFDNGYVYLGGGVRGIVVVRQNAQQYLAFERNCPYEPYNACAKVTVDKSGFFMADSCCGSRFDMRGQVTSGPARRPLRQYSTALSGNLLYVTN